MNAGFTRPGHGSEPLGLIVTSRLADVYLWAKVLSLGGHDVLAKPFTPEEVCGVVESAFVSITRSSRSGGQPEEARRY